MLGPWLCLVGVFVSMESMGFPGTSAGKEVTHNAGDPSSIPGSGRSPGEGIGYPLQYSWASLVVQMAKNLYSNCVVCIACKS